MQNRLYGFNLDLVAKPDELTVERADRRKNEAYTFATSVYSVLLNVNPCGRPCTQRVLALDQIPQREPSIGVCGYFCGWLAPPWRLAAQGGGYENINRWRAALVQNHSGDMLLIEPYGQAKSSDPALPVA